MPDMVRDRYSNGYNPNPITSTLTIITRYPNATNPNPTDPKSTNPNLNRDSRPEP